MTQLSSLSLGHLHVFVIIVLCTDSIYTHFLPQTMCFEGTKVFETQSLNTVEKT